MFWTQFTEAGFASVVVAVETGVGGGAGQDMAVIMSSEMHLSLPAGCHPNGQVAHNSGTSASVGHPIETSGQPASPLLHSSGMQDIPSSEERMFPGQLGQAAITGAFFGWLYAARKRNKTANSRITCFRYFMKVPRPVRIKSVSVVGWCRAPLANCLGAHSGHLKYFTRKVDVFAQML